MQKLLRRLTVLAMALALLCGVTAAAGAGESGQTLTILFTHDTHDHFYPNAGDLGGYVRLATLLDREREKTAGPVVTLDAGDFSMGSLFQTVYTTSAPELRALGAMGYDVTTLGNHEFDYRGRGLAEMLTTARAFREAGTYLPAIVQANYHPREGTSAAAAHALSSYPVTDYTVLEREGLWIAVFGLMGVDADECAPMSGMELEPVAEAARRVVAEIQEKEDPDFIICLSHVGTEDGKGEDYELAEAVDGIDVIVSGHTHTTLAEPIRVKDTLIVSAGDYTGSLGRLVLEKRGEQVSAQDYELIPVDSSIPEDPAMSALAEDLKAEVEEGFLAGYGLTYDQVLTKVERDFTTQETGDLIGRAYIAAVQRIEGEAYEPVTFAVAPDGVIRDRFRAGTITTAQAFDVLSLGSGGDGSPTYPLLSVYLTGEDLKNAFEVDASISPILGYATLYGAGVHWTYNPHRMLLDKVTYSARLTEDGGAAPIQPDRLYRVVADLYSGQMLGAVEEQSFGILSITPRDENGDPVTDLESRIIHLDDGSELKAWYALASYLAEQETAVPPASCKTVSPSWSPFALLASPGVPTLIALAVLLLLAALVVLAVRAVVRRRKRRRGKH